MNVFSKNSRLTQYYKKQAIFVDQWTEKLEKESDDFLLEQFKEIQKSIIDKQNFIYKKGFTKSIYRNSTYQWVLKALAIVVIMTERTLKLRAFGEQIMGSLAIIDGKIVEMKTGEGKTLSIAMASAVLAIEQNGVHVVTVNDYLAKRDSHYNQKLFYSLGLNVGVSLPTMSKEDKRKAYNQNITYVTNTEIGFDFLKDNMVLKPEDKILKKMYYSIIDEVDSILIDEARTPLIISGPNYENTNIYQIMDNVARQMNQSQYESNERDYYIDIKRKKVYLSDEGSERAEKLLQEKNVISPTSNLFDSENITYVYHLNAALKAHGLLKLNSDYIIKKRKIQIIDEYTGRVLPGRKWGSGLHQAVEAKESLMVHPEQQIIATITLQNLFRSYAHISGMTGTAFTEKEEFSEIYGLQTIAIPTHKTMIRKDYPDIIFLNKKAKYKKIVEDIVKIHQTEQPVLIGTTSVEMSEFFSTALNKKHVPHHVLNAKFHEKEAEIIKDAGRLKSVTIATNMAGRGTDIILGGEYHESQYYSRWQSEHEKVKALGGLYVIGTERHESRRIDDQLRGRSGRQGDPGTSQFYVSFEDTLLSVYAPPWAQNALKRLGMGENDILTKPAIGQQVRRAQKTVEDYYFSVRKSLIKYDDVNDIQRQTFYELRNHALNYDNMTDYIQELIDKEKEELFYQAYQIYQKNDMSFIKAWNKSLDNEEFKEVFAISYQKKIKATIEQEHRNESKLKKTIFSHVDTSFKTFIENKFSSIEDNQRNNLFKEIILSSYDLHWQEHIDEIDMLRKVIHLRTYAQKKPIQEYKIEAFALFKEMLSHIKEVALRGLIKVDMSEYEKEKQIQQQKLKNEEEIIG